MHLFFVFILPLLLVIAQDDDSNGNIGVGPDKYIDPSIEKSRNDLKVDSTLATGALPGLHNDQSAPRPADYSESWEVCSNVVCQDLMPPNTPSGRDQSSILSFNKEEQAACLFGCRVALEGTITLEKHCKQYCDGIWMDPVVVPYLWDNPSAGQKLHWIGICINRCLEGYKIHLPIIEKANEEYLKKIEEKAKAMEERERKEMERKDTRPAANT
eukprot:g1057.t1